MIEEVVANFLAQRASEISASTTMLGLMHAAYFVGLVKGGMSEAQAQFAAGRFMKDLCLGALVEAIKGRQAETKKP
jgi:hypothetical protein